MFTIGCDPELFLKDSGTNKFISIVGLIGGTKEKPMPIGMGCAIQEDNVAAEFCIPPATSFEAFNKSIQFALNDINTRAEKLGLTLASLVASTSFEDDQLKTRAAQEFGCDPDYNAYTQAPNPRPKTDNKNLRSAGGHVHVGTENNVFHMTKTMDLLLGVPSLLIDTDEDRRKLYGKAGCFRPKDYGLEYRTLSNFWIWSPSTVEWVYNQTLSADQTCKEFNETLKDDQWSIIQQCINNNDKETARQLVNNYNIPMP